MKAVNEIKEAIGIAIGEASMCWDPKPSGVFDSTHAGTIVDRIMNIISVDLLAPITWEQFTQAVNLVLDFHSLPESAREQILLMMDGLKFRREKQK
ncbi:hypothetical protein E6Q11_02370 [Candidatus Dojkabacteria bacterium]|uniref:Uncharacterized protein n=1 Tax=Candidatus Dojkabacteria bacterium TaxID=2099670 RepID=A0A5C7J845_9BACT|nr:MAG: hypothetical protein E6Q11_02370 [Candidatus Dojkabacteria bacterium]